MKQNAFTIGLPKQPTIGSITPKEAYVNSTFVITVKGTDFQPDGGTYVNLFHPDGPQNITVNPVSVTPTQFTGTVTIPADAPTTTLWKLNLSTINGGAAKPQAFTIKSVPAPGFGSLTPTSGFENTTVAFTLKGSNFQATEDGGTNVTFWNKATNQVLLSTLYSVNSTWAVGSVELPNYYNGTWAVNISTGDGGTITKNAGFKVTHADPPTLKAFSPALGYRGTTISFIVTGTNFQNGDRTSIALEQPGQAEIPAVLTSISTSQLAGYAELPSDAATGYWSANVTTIDGGSKTLSKALSVL
jgi:hypothetical protein